jgi:transposase InsO family protein
MPFSTSTALVDRACKRRQRAQGTPLSQALAPNELWCTDFKAGFKLGNGQYCYPLTVTDQASRKLLLLEALQSAKEAPVLEAFHRLFQDRGLCRDPKR